MPTVTYAQVSELESQGLTDPEIRQRLGIVDTQLRTLRDGGPGTTVESSTLTEGAQAGQTGGTVTSDEAGRRFATDDPITVDLLNDLRIFEGNPNLSERLRANIRTTLRIAEGVEPQQAVLLRLRREAESEVARPTSLTERVRENISTDALSLFDQLPLSQQIEIASQLPEDATPQQIAEVVGPLLPRPSYSQTDPLGYAYVVGEISETTGLSTSSAKMLVDSRAAEKGYTQPTELLQDEELFDQAARLVVGNFLPDRFVDENGVFYTNVPGYGPVPTAQQIPGETLTTEERISFGAIGGHVQRAAASLPVVQSSELAQLLERERLRQRALSGGFGGGGGGISFDREAIRQRIQQTWQQLMVEDPPNLDQLVNKYTQDASVYGGQLNVNAWTVAQMRQSARYRTLYEKKPPHLSEEEYIGRYAGTVEQAGLSDRVSVRETEAGLTSGASAAGFAERLGRTREVQIGGLGNLSRQFARTMASLGPLARS